MLRCPALAGRITGVSRSVEPLVRHVLISRCLPPTSRAARTRAPPRPRPQPHRQSHQRFVTASPVRRQQHTHVVAPCLRPFLVRPPILRPDPGLAASPPVRYTSKVARSEISLPLPLSSLGTDNLLAKRRCATYGGTRRWPGRMSHRPTDAAAEREVLKARTPSSAPPFSRRSSRNASAGRSSPNGRPPSFTAAVAQIGRNPSERPHATPPGSPRSWPGCPAEPSGPGIPSRGVPTSLVDRDQDSL